jgi:hypothetical protein
MQATIEILQNPSRAKTFFEKLSQTSSPTRPYEKTSTGSHSPPEYLTEEAQGTLDGGSVEEESPDLKELERRIEQLARDLEKVSHMAEGMRRSPSGSFQKSSTFSVSCRPNPPKDQISFFACTPPSPLVLALKT